MKYNVGDKFVIEIKNVYDGEVFPYGLVAGGTVSEEFLDKLQRLTAVDRNASPEEFNKGMEEAWRLAKLIYKPVEDGGLMGKDLKKYFGCVYKDIHKLSIQDVVDGIKRYEEDQKLDWSKVPVDTPILVRDNDANPWVKRHFAKYEDGKVYSWRFGKTSYTGDEIIRWNQAKLPEGK